MSSFFSSLDINGYGLSAQRARVNIISANIANADTTRTSEGGPYKRKSVVFRAVDFKHNLDEMKQKYNIDGIEYADPLQTGYKDKPKFITQGVIVDKIVRDDTPAKMKYEPNHPDANTNGYVAYPNINPVVEMADLIEATRAYQSNIAAFENTKSMYNSTISLLQ
jgi:flagellar basal-body rod protein FlgC